MYFSDEKVPRTLQLFFCAVVALLVLSQYAATQAPAPSAKPVVPQGGPTVLSDRQVKFVLNAPQATQVMLNLQNDIGPSPAAKQIEMTKDAAGGWSVTIGPLKPNYYGYGFIVDGATIPDPANRNIWNQRNSAWSAVFVPGPEADYMADNPVPHGYVATVRYFSKVTDSERQMTVYTPPGYGKSTQSYPVLYLSHGGGGNDTDWIVCMRANYIMDNLIAQGKAKPMIIVMPDGNVNVQGQSMSITQNRYPQELLGNVIPAAEQNFRIAPGPQNRGLAGLSMGGGLTLATIFQKSGALAYYGIFSSGMSDAIREDLVKNHMDLLTNVATNKEIKLIWIACGGPEDVAYKGNLATVDFFKKYNINHQFIQGAGGHIWDVWRHNLLDLAPLLFR